MSLNINLDEVPALIRSIKTELRARLPAYQQAFADMSRSLEEEIREIMALRDAGQSPIPEVSFADVQAGSISEEQRALIKKRGCVVVRGVFSTPLANDWNERIGDYITRNGYYETKDKGLDQYFSSLQNAKPQIFSIYWSKPQIDARQHEHLAETRRFLNHLWTFEHDGQIEFDPDRECTYADRTRRREPGDNSLGLKPHTDGGTIERWLDREGYHQVYRHVLSGNWQDYDPFDAAYRTATNEIPSPAVCSMFRTFQGWTALTPQGPGDGTLQLIPSARVAAWMVLRALQDDVPEYNLCDARAGRALSCSPQWHQLVLDGLCSIPQMQPGDTVWWHPDVVHAVEDSHQGSGYSNVIYIGAAPYCGKNVAYQDKQLAAFRKGASSPDFAAEDYELEYAGRASEADLSELGRKQMGLDAW